ncbi:conserved hypothetical protein [Theileria orientalis strain Shintoku]|uniref:At4g15545-like C-terminal domain-containing protein n=1 Tax=Theileria orientalis strain Shintoku TaxID=869250 RepID=J4DPK5_THEOR|nr:conserved hypothetical protein [Theileria orientalis strain Shintoku]PVC53438.1 hypothetical protein MACL_00000060 [Theileria orientalis]BAM40864.1 conserved hypothetical protein [Theileria orientalis strain Shintoku]|eukprot:XP_009691165.1 conserved hypothetical protein [Theileria orientalis strain Shintoku]
MEFSTVDLSWLPNDADEQLALGFRVVSNAYKTRVSGLESELRSMRTLVSEKTEHVAVLQKKYSTLEDQLVQLNQRANQLTEENKNLVNTVKKLQRDLDRLENLKKMVLSSFKDDLNESDTNNRFYGLDEMVNSVVPRTGLGMRNDYATLQEYNTNAAGDGFLKNHAYSSTPKPLQDTPLPTAQRESVDGRQFFKNAKNILHPDDFASFLSTIKKFNAQLLTRDETLAHAKQVFGEDSRAFEDFRQLIMPRH